MSIDVSKIKPGDTVTIYRSTDPRNWLELRGTYCTVIVAQAHRDYVGGRDSAGRYHGSQGWHLAAGLHRIVSHTPAATSVHAGGLSWPITAEQARQYVKPTWLGLFGSAPDIELTDADAAEQKLAEAVRGRETALRDLRKAEQRADDQDECAKRWFREAATESARAEKAETRIAELSAVSDSYNEVWTDLQRAGSAYKSARQRAWSWKGTAEALGDQLDRKIKKLRKQRDKARKANAERAADELESLADWFFDRLPDGTGNGRAYNSYTVARIARDRAAKLRGEK